MDEDGNPIQLSDVEKEGDGGVGDEGLVGNRVQEPDAEVKAEVKDASTPTPKRKRAPAKSKAKVKVEPEREVALEEKPVVDEAESNKENEPVKDEEAQPAVKAKAPPKKRAKKA